MLPTRIMSCSPCTSGRIAEPVRQQRVVSGRLHTPRLTQRRRIAPCTSASQQPFRKCCLGEARGGDACCSFPMNSVFSKMLKRASVHMVGLQTQQALVRRVVRSACIANQQTTKTGAFVPAPTPPPEAPPLLVPSALPCDQFAPTRRATFRPDPQVTPLQRPERGGCS